MNDTITICGTVGTDPKQIQTATGLDITSFRVASNRRRFDKQKQEWIDGETNWYGVSAYRHLARNCASSLKKGDPIVVTGRIRIRSWESEEKKGLTIDIDADAIGHNLMFGTASYTRTARKPDAEADADASTNAGGDETAPQGAGEEPSDSPAEVADAVATPF